MSDDINVLWLAMAIDGHTLAYGPTEPIHDEGTCSSDCAGDIRTRYLQEQVDAASGPTMNPHPNKDGVWL